MLLYAEYVVDSIDGDYAHLVRTDLVKEEPEQENDKLVARALLPPETGEGTKLVYEMMQYSIQK